MCLADFVKAELLQYAEAQMFIDEGGSGKRKQKEFKAEKARD